MFLGLLYALNVSGGMIHDLIYILSTITCSGDIQESTATCRF